MHDRWSEARTLVKQYLNEAQQVQKKAFDKKHREVIFKPGDLVAIYKKSRKKGKNEKMMCNFTGPWIVEKKYDIPEIVFSIKPFESGNYRNIPIVFMKKWYERNEDNSEEISDDEINKDSDNSPTTVK